jgi:uncharacterized protein with FMN-binding domain
VRDLERERDTGAEPRAAITAWSERRRSAGVVLGAMAAVALLIDAKSSPTVHQESPIGSVRAAVGAPPLPSSPGTPVDNRVPSQEDAPAQSRDVSPTSRPSAAVVPPAPGSAASSSTTTTQRSNAPGETRYEGVVVPTNFGDLQVAAVMNGARMTDVQALKLPDDSPRTRQISEDAAVRLRANALQCQCWQVDTISGATVTSDAYRRSLQSALAKAGHL